MDIATIIGIILGFGAVIGGQILEGGHISALLQPTAFLIVAGGTCGATFVSFPLASILQALKDIRKALFPSQEGHEAIIKDMIGYAAKARKNGLISLEQDALGIKDRFTRKGITMVVDGIDPQKLRETLEVELNVFEEHSKVSAEVFESAGGFAPTIGIIGAVLGLIHVMENLSDASKLGGGIAVAFVATIYGLMIANLICIPLSTKLKHRLKEAMLLKEMVIEGLIAIQNGENPHFIEQRMRSYLHEESKPEKSSPDSKGK
jgi:chemotaxis protein MotA